MIPNANEAATVQSNMTGRRGQFTVDENSLTHIMSVLTNLYKDPELAVIREYLTNARDSHIEAGTTRPVEVTTPSHFNKSFIVKDYGLGMSVDDIENVYSKYGASTKRGSNAVVGMLGLGSKSALTYTNMFTITGVKNGVMTKAVISVNEDGVPEFTIADTKATNEPNGVEIMVPVQDRNSFEEKTKNFLKFWEDGVVLVNGHEPAKHGLTKIKDTPVTFEVTDEQGDRHKFTEDAEIYLLEDVGGWRSEWTGSKVVMGNVTYDVDSAYVDEALRRGGMGFVAYVPIGSLTIIPAREGLHYTTATKAVLKQISSNLMEHIVKAKREKFENAASLKEAYEYWADMSSLFTTHPGMSGANYKGLVWKQHFQHDAVNVSWDYNGRGNTGSVSYIYIGNLLQHDEPVLVVTGVDTDKKVNGFFKKKVRHYAQQQGYSDDYVLLVEKDFNEPWLADTPRIDADTIKKIKLPRAASTGAPRVEATYDFYQWDAVAQDAVFDTALKVPGKKLAYISPTDMRETYRKQGTTPRYMAELIADPDLVIVVLGTNRIEKFKRSHPKAKPLKDYVQKRVNEWAKGASNAEHIAKSLDYNEEMFFKAVNPAKLDDPALAELAKVVKSTDTDLYSQAEGLHLHARRANIYTTLPARKNPGKNPAKRYPLLAHVGNECLADTILYVNAKFNN